jgi:hypothetical protein
MGGLPRVQQAILAGEAAKETAHPRVWQCFPFPKVAGKEAS